jgi:hypothetical protein
MLLYEDTISVIQQYHPMNNNTLARAVSTCIAHATTIDSTTQPSLGGVAARWKENQTSFVRSFIQAMIQALETTKKSLVT